MKFDRLWQSLLLTSYIAVFIASPAQAEKPETEIRATKQNIPQLGDIELPATSAKLLVQQPSPTNPPTTSGEVIGITGVKANPTDKGVEVILETSQGDKLEVANRSMGNNFIADITGGQLRLPDGNAFTFKSEKPIKGITEITVTNIDENTVRVTVVGEKALPAVELFDDDAGLIFAVAATTTTATEETPPQEQPAAQEDDPIELVVTGEQDNYRVPNASVGTRTDTPLRDIPQSIQVVPQQVLQDRQARSIRDGLENASGIAPITSSAGTRQYFTARGFELYSGFLVNGIPDPLIGQDGGFTNVERLEVLKGPASVLYGESGSGSLGATVNVVTRQPLRDPFYELSATVGSFNDYRGTLDFSGSLNTSKTAVYRFIVGYQSNETFVDFNDSRTFSIAPSLSFSLSPNTDLVVEGDVNRIRRNGSYDGVPAIGTVLPNPNGRLSRSFSATGPQEDYVVDNGRIGYRLEHRFNENWKLRNAFLYSFFIESASPVIFASSLADDNRTLK